VCGFPHLVNSHKNKELEKKEIFRSMSELENQLKKLLSTGTATVGGVTRINRKLRALLEMTNGLIDKKQNADIGNLP